MNYSQIMKTIVSSTKWCRFNSLSIGIESYVDFTFLRRRFYVLEQKSDQHWGIILRNIGEKEIWPLPVDLIKKDC